MLIKDDFEGRELKSRNEIVKSIFLEYGVECCGIAPVKFGNEIREILQREQKRIILAVWKRVI